MKPKQAINSLLFQMKLNGELHWFIFIICADGTMWQRNITLGGEWFEQEGPPEGKSWPNE